MNPQPILPRKPSLQGYSAPAAPDQIASARVGTLSFWFCVAYTFLLCSRAVEFIDTTGRLHLSIITGVFCLLALLTTGNMPKMLFSRQGRWLTLLCFWIFLGLPFSMWRGGSVQVFSNLWIKSYLMFFIVGGLIFTLAQARKMTIVLAMCAVCQVYLAFRGGIVEENRLSMAYGTLGNANDLATALLMGFPYMVFVIIDRKANGFLRFFLVPISILLFVAVLRTGSRGGLITIVALLAVAFVRSAGTAKIKILVSALLVAVLFAAVVPANLRGRYMTIFKTNVTAATNGDESSALDSSNARRELLKNSVILTMRHPVFGVGLGQFSPQSFNLFIARGIPGMWFTSHDVFGLVSAETGIPGLVFFCGTLVVCFIPLWKMSKLAPVNPDVKLISGLAYCMLMSLVAFTVCGIFSTQAYNYQLPVLASLTAALQRVAAPYLAVAGLTPEQEFAVPPPFVNRRLARPAVTAALSSTL